MMNWDAIKSDLNHLNEMLFGIWRKVTAANSMDAPLTTTEIAVGTGVFLLAVIFLVLLLSLVRPARKTVSGKPLSGQTRGARILGYGVALLFFGVLGVWSWYAPLSSAALAPGVVSPDGSRKTVQHLEGGIIQRIHVREGETVAAGDTLITLENVRALARLDELRERMIFLLATEARLLTEADDRDTINFDFPADLIEAASAQVELASRGQRQLFESRRETQDARARILAKRIDQLNEEITGLEEVIAAQNEQLGLIGQELQATKELYDQGLQRLSPYLALQRQEADLKAERAANRASIARLGQQIGETELQLYAIGQQSREEVNEELSRVRTELATIRSQIPERADALERTTVTAPIAGQVLNIRVTTEAGGILRPGGEILDIVPDNATMIVDARVSPQDIDTVYPGMSAQVLLTAYAQRNLPRIYGTLQSVSADRLVDDRTGEPYFLAKVFVDADELAALAEEVELMVGMPADVMILTGERTMLDYLLKPFSDSLRGSFRES
ncbi:HlyD family type I secretion periplasmic adaptor subunit [Actibacterium pelagium]|uniref:Membrane fusion protein (MFP) family protein n=1 Tax=Actibacterium pelagium TaxID=2029103 RepID=A0A917AGX7_9RHOB|nr:HlyD family type I secretion periplasmic adaptor subunit [Actibacterium pelagium]GGE52043.1 HlyD family type I secretion periplasmic adaptor subunit [Actibacterium pelagium]